MPDATSQPGGAEALSVSYREATKIYPGAEAPAVDALSLEVQAGEICVLVGPSGCGKTTAMRMVNRMVDITSGDILVGDRSVRERAPAELRREIGYVIQQIGLFPHRTIAENISTVPAMLGWEKDRLAARVDELVGLIGLDPELRDRYPSQLSGGQQQRVGVARALAANPPGVLPPPGRVRSRRCRRVTPTAGERLFPSRSAGRRSATPAPTSPPWTA